MLGIKGMLLDSSGKASLLYNYLCYIFVQECVSYVFDSYFLNISIIILFSVEKRIITFFSEVSLFLLRW